MSGKNEDIEQLKCSSCDSVNPSGNKYCGNCGTLLGVEPNLRSQILSVLENEYKDQKVVESEIAERIATKLIGWAKLLASGIGAPITILLIVLGVIGIKSYRDFTNMVANAKRDAELNVEAARKEGEAITTQYRSLRDQLTQATGLANDVKLLSAKVNQISERIGFVPTAALTPDLQAYMESSLAQFRQHLQGIGYKVTESEIKIAVNDKNRYGPAYYQEGVIYVETAYATDIDVFFREYSHHAMLTSSEIKLGNNQFTGLESGLASYFACSFNGDPALGEKSVAAFAKTYNAPEFVQKGAIHQLKNERKFGDLAENPRDLNYVPAEVWGGTFWELRELFGRDYTDRLVLETWKSLREKDAGGNLPGYFYNRMLETDKSLQGNHQNQIRQVFSQRGLAV